jgi:2-polyprenyl-6-methoxyphenol hydroxylase-like FAD-dependent oxidoreductase
MLIGADGIDSVVRNQLMDGEVEPNFASACVMSGVTRLNVPPMDVPDVFPNGVEVPELSKQDVSDFCAEGQGRSVVGGGMAFGCLPLGNGMVAWNLITSQDVPGINGLSNMC